MFSQKFCRKLKQLARLNFNFGKSKKSFQRENPQEIPPNPKISNKKRD